MLRIDFDKTGGLMLFLEDFIKMYNTLRTQIAAIALSMQNNQSFAGTVPRGAPYISFGMSEITDPSVGSNLELYGGYFVTAEGEIVLVEQCSVPISTSTTVAYIEIVETVAAESSRQLEDTGATVNVLFERKGVVKTSPAFDTLAETVEAYAIYLGTVKTVPHLREKLDTLINV